MESPIEINQIHQSFDQINIEDLRRLGDIVKEKDIIELYSYTWDKCLIVKFDWPKWEQGSDFYCQDRWLFDDKDLVFCYKFLTAVIRNGRFVDNAVERILEEGALVGLIDRMLELKEKYTIA